MSNEQTLWARHMEAIQQQEKALEDRWKRERRERIATVALQGMLACPNNAGSWSAFAQDAVALADALIAELDKPEEEKA